MRVTREEAIDMLVDLQLDMISNFSHQERQDYVEGLLRGDLDPITKYTNEELLDALELINDPDDTIEIVKVLTI